eukprot:COSAG02_NODE_40345_length_406_cov_1.485342_1_plen_37_part_10
MREVAKIGVTNKLTADGQKDIGVTNKLTADGQKDIGV